MATITIQDLGEGKKTNRDTLTLDVGIVYGPFNLSGGNFQVHDIE